MRSVSRLAAVAAGASLVASACGVPLQDDPEALSARLPDDLVASVTTSTVAPSTVTATIYLVERLDDQTQILRPTTRDVPAGSGVSGVLQTLLSSPATSEEADRGLLTLISDPGTTQVVAVDVEADDEVAAITFSNLDAFPDDSVLAWGQVVCTAVAFASSTDAFGFDRIVIQRVGEDGEFEGINTPVPDNATGAVPPGTSVGCASDYRSLLRP